MASNTTRALKPVFGFHKAERFGYREAAAFSDTSRFRSIRQYQMLAQSWGIENPFFKIQESRSKRSVTIDGRQLVNFGWCDYLGLSDHPEVLAAARSAIDAFGSCISASRMISGTLDMHQQLETEIAEFFGFENSLMFVSGHAANVSTIATLVNKGDLVIHDEFVHNSAIVGARLSGAEIKTFKHNNLESLVRLLLRNRDSFRNVLIVIEGLYSTEGDCVDLSSLIEIKEKFGCWLMVDDAHGVGVLGESGRGVAEYTGVDPRKIDVFMGTLSKSLASCGGFIAGNAELIEILKYSSPGFVYSVSLPPAMTAAALASLRILKSEPERVHRLHDNCKLFFRDCRARGFDTGTSIGLGMVPIIVGSVKNTGKLLERMYEQGFNPSPIIYPGVRINSGRLRFFISSEHSVDELQSCAEALSR